MQRLLKSVGVEPERCRMFTMSAGEPPKFVAAVREMDRAVSALPPLERSAPSAASSKAAIREAVSAAGVSPAAETRLVRGAA